MKKFLLIPFLLLAGFCQAQQAININNNQWQSAVGMQSVPATLAVLFPTTTYLTAIHLSDPVTTPITVSIYDGSTLIYSIPLGGTNPLIFDYVFPRPLSIATSVSWQASATGIVGNITGVN